MKFFFNYSNHEVRLKKYIKEEPEAQTIVLDENFALFSFSESTIRKHCKDHRLRVIDVDNFSIFPEQHVDHVVQNTIDSYQK